MPFGLKKALRFNRRHAPGPRGRDGLPVGPVLHVARVKHPMDVGSRPAMAHDVAVVVQVDLSLERLGVRNMADGQKNPSTS